MTEKQERLKAYIYKVTRGLWSIKEEHAEAIERIVNSPRAYAKMSKWNSQLSSYAHTFTETLEEKQIEYILKKYEHKRQVTNCAKWDFYNSAGEFMGTVYTSSYVLNYLLL